MRNDMSSTDAAELALSEIRAAPAHAPFVVAQLGQSLDGRIATITGHSRWINGEHALDHLHALRAAVDAVVVGVRSVIADDPQLTVRRVPGRHPARVVIDPDGRAPPTARCFQDDSTPVFRVCVRAVPEPATVRPIVLARGANGIIPPTNIVSSLFRIGLRRILVEGGATTISHFIDAGSIDRLHVLLAPVILGSGRAALDLTPIQTMQQARRPAHRVHRFADGDVLFDCDLRRPSA